MIVVDSQAGVDLGTEKAWDLVNKENLAVMFVVNKMTRENIEIDKIIDDIKESLSDKATLIQLPLGIGPDFKGIIDIVTGKAYEYKDGIAKETAVPADMNERVETMRTELIEKIAESDESLMEKFFEESLSDDDITKGFNTAIKAGNIYPICFADAHENIGTDKIMDVISNYLPSAADKEEYACKDGFVKIGDAFSGFIFKTTVEKHVGDMAYLRIFSGELKPGSEVINIEKGSSEKINQVYTVVGKNRKEVDCLPAGGMCILVKLKNSTTNDTLVDKTVKKQFNEIEFPKANVSMAIVPQTKGDEEKISNGLQKLSDEDPSFYYNFDPEIRQTLIHGLGTIHLEVIVNKLKEKFGVNVTLKKPRIKYRETITKEASAEGKHKKQSGGRGQFGLCNVKFEPLARDGGIEFVNKIFGGSIPTKFVPSVEKGIREQTAKGLLAGYPVVDIRATLYDGKFHPVDSSDIAFQIAGSLSLKAGMVKANPILLEPIMRVGVIVPEEYMGDVMGDVNTRRGKILGVDTIGKKQKINALVPESEMYQYSSQLRSMTQGRGAFSMEHETYEPVPQEQTDKIIEEAKKLIEEEEK